MFYAQFSFSLPDKAKTEIEQPNGCGESTYKENNTSRVFCNKMQNIFCKILERNLFEIACQQSIMKNSGRVKQTLICDNML